MASVLAVVPFFLLPERKGNWHELCSGFAPDHTLSFLSVTLKLE